MCVCVCVWGYQCRCVLSVCVCVCACAWQGMDAEISELQGEFDELLPLVQTAFLQTGCAKLFAEVSLFCSSDCGLGRLCGGSSLCLLSL
ncbi:MAG: hypothetical protein P4L40_04830 [Terracidiphilus sp.]|nr:hypothetical protein [Terracidiphilus sp.]